MAQIYKSVRGKKIAKYIAGLPVVQDRMDNIIFEAGSKAETMLQETRLNDDPLMVHGASIHISESGVDRILTLEDRATAPADLNPLVRNMNSAASIELGRAGGQKSITVREMDESGNWTGNFVQKEVKWGDMEGLHILSRALGAKRFNKKG